LIALVGVALAGGEALAQKADDPDDIPLLDRALSLATSAAMFALLVAGPVALGASASRSSSASTAILAALGSVAALGIGLRLRAIRVLGAGFITRSEPRSNERVRQDVYRWLRHPSEVGLALIGVAAAAMEASILAVAALVVLLASSATRIVLEERALRLAFRR
jgi:protein-S-isoprenylcysteine O-methyltransferase Ste14